MNYYFEDQIRLAEDSHAEDAVLNDGTRVIGDWSEFRQIFELHPEKRPKFKLATWLNPQLLALTLEKDKKSDNEEGKYYEEFTTEEILNILEEYPDLITTLNFSRKSKGKMQPNHLKRLKNIIIKSKTITKLQFTSEFADMKAIRKALEKNTSVTQLLVKFWTVILNSRNFTKEIVKMIQNNPRLKTIQITALNIDFFSATMTAACLNPSINTLILNDIFINTVRDTLLKMERITDLTIIGYNSTEANFPVIVDLIKQNNIKKLDLKDNAQSYQELNTDISTFISAVQLNTSLTSLSISGRCITADVAVLLMNHSNIKALNIGVCVYGAHSIEPIQKALESKHSLESLALTAIWQQHTGNASMKPILNALHKNTTMKSIILRSFDNLDAESIGSLLKNNSTLTSLEVRPTLNLDSETEANMIIEGLKANRTIRSMSIHFSNSSRSRWAIYAAMSDHPSLTSLCLFQTDPLLKHAVLCKDSKNLLSLPENEGYKIRALLQRNRDRLVAERYGTIYGITAIKKWMWDLLPAELWFKICSYTAQGTVIDYKRLLNE